MSPTPSPAIFITAETSSWSKMRPLSRLCVPVSPAGFRADAAVVEVSPNRQVVRRRSFLPQLFFTDLSALSRSATVDGVTHRLTPAEIAAARDIGLVDGMPFILGPDGIYDHQLNRFLRAGPTMGVRSMNSLRAYARDIVVWMRFLAERRRANHYGRPIATTSQRSMRQGACSSRLIESRRRPGIG